LGVSGGDLPVVGIMRRFRWAAILTGLVLLECGVLALNGGRCPLSDLAARFTNDRANTKSFLARSSSLANWCWSRQMFATSTRQANTSSQKVAR